MVLPERKNYSKNRAAFRIVKDLYLALVGFYNFPGDWQTKSCTLFLGAKKGNKDSFSLFKWNAATAINYVDDAFVLYLAAAYNDSRPFR